MTAPTPDLEVHEAVAKQVGHLVIENIHLATRLRRLDELAARPSPDLPAIPPELVEAISGQLAAGGISPAAGEVLRAASPDLASALPARPPPTTNGATPPPSAGGRLLDDYRATLPPAPPPLAMAGIG